MGSQGHTNGVSSSPVTALFYGRAGCGKGTQLALLKEYLEKSDSSKKTLQVETGAAFRRFTGENPTYTGKAVLEILNRGGLPDAFISVWLWTQALVDSYTGTEHLLFDGFPRRVLEAEMLDGALSLYDRDPVTLFVLNVPEEKVIERLRLRQRADDVSEDRIRRRLTWYESDVVPTIEYYKRKGGRYTVHEIDGNRSIEAVQQDIIQKLGLVPQK